MKNLLLTLTLLLVINIANATDRIVQELGLGGAYTTINSAISASNDGDRILVYPKSGGYYLENVNDNNKDLHLISAVEGQRFEIFGSVTLHGSILLEAHVIGAITAGANGNGYGDVHIIDCVTSSIDQINNATNALYIDNSIISGHIIIYNKGRIRGCNIEQGSGQDAISFNSGIYLNADTNIVVGNKIVLNSSNISGIKNNSSTSYFYFSNNYIKATASSFNTTGINIISTSSQHAPKFSTIINNTIVGLGSIGYGIFTQVAGKYDIRNNIVFAISVNSYSYYIAPSNIPLLFRSNYSNNNSASPSYLNGGTNNLQVTNTAINPDGTLAPGSEPINGGDPSLDMLDLDLTRNDAGCYGGSLSLANFITPETGSRVLFMNAPRFIFTGQPATISGEGVDK